MAITMNVTVLDVGQGMGTFVEIYDTSGALISTLLFDLGSLNNKVSAGGPSVQYIVDKLKSMADPTIDLLVLSHKDGDHVNLIEDLLKFFPSLNDLLIEKVYYGGRTNWYPAGLLNEIKKHTYDEDGDVSSFVVSATCYGTVGVVPPIYSVNGVTVNVLVANTPTAGETPGAKSSTLPQAPNDNATNTGSVVCLVTYNSESFIIAGDATYNTLCRINTIFNGVTFPAVAMLTMPHHGSRKTTFGLGATNAEISDVQKQGVKAFVDLVKALSLTVSADRKHEHPSLETIDEFSTYVSKDNPWYSDPAFGTEKLHSVTTKVDTRLNYNTGNDLELDYYSFETQANIYTTLYSTGIDDTDFSYSAFLSTNTLVTALNLTIPYPLLPEGVSWQYSLTPTTGTLYQLTNRAGVTASSASVFSASFESQASAQNKTEAQQPAQPASPKLSSMALRPAIASRAPTLSRLKALR
ncbi:MAG: hypothetical protein ACXWT1_00860 [Methylobacter sp.]